MMTAFSSLYQWLTATLAGKVLVAGVASMLPVVELRLGIPLAVGLGLAPKFAIPLCVVCNCLPIIPVLLLFQHILKWMRHIGGPLSTFANFLEAKALRHRGTLDTYAVFGLFLLTAIPLPGTGAWTASALAALAGVRIRKAAPAIILGVIAAGALVAFVSYGVAALI